MTSACCGQPSSKRRVRAPALPANPKVPAGTRLLFLGSGRTELRGDGSGYSYHVSDNRRAFFAHPDDVATLLTHTDIVRAR